MAHGHDPDDLADMVVGDIEAIAVYHMRHSKAPNVSDS